MASSKSTSKPAKAAPAVKEGRVTKPAQTPNSKKKEMSKNVAAKVELKDKKDKKARKVKEPTPEPEADSEDDSEDDSDVDDSEDSADSDSDEKHAKIAAEAPKINGAAKKDPAADGDSDDDSEEGSEDDSADSDSSDAESDEEPAAAHASKAATAAAEADDTSDESDSSEDEAPPKANGVKINGAAKKVDAESSDEDENDDSEDSGSSISDSESDEEEAAPPKKRKADEPITPVTPAAKKSKTDEADTEASKNLFVGNLSWNVDEEWLMREFEGFGELAGCRVITDRESGRSKGFGYVEFTSAADAAQALEEKNGAMVDGRNIRLDFSSGRTPKTENTPQQRAQRFGDSRSNPSDTLFIGNISFECTNDMVGDAFAEFGTITSVRLPTDRESGQLKGFGYISFSSVEEAQSALDAMSGEQIAGRPIRLDFAGPRPDNGGAGGRGGRGGFGDRGGRGGRGGFGDRGGRGGGRGGGFRGGRGGRGGTTNRGGFGDFQGKKMTF